MKICFMVVYVTGFDVYQCIVEASDDKDAAIKAELYGIKNIVSVTNTKCYLLK